MSARVNLMWMPWCSWRGWLYLMTFMLTSSHLFFSQRFLPIFSDSQINSIIPRNAWTSNGLFEDDQMNQGNVNSSKSTVFTAESNYINWTSLLQNNETSERRKEEQVDKISSLNEKERRYWLRSERIKRVCHNQGVVSNPTIFTISKKSLPVHLSSSVNLPGKQVYGKHVEFIFFLIIM